MQENARRFIEEMKHPAKFRVFLFTKLPSAYFAGVRIKDISPEKCEVTIPYKWFSQNPFRSTYFACLGMAAEMSTGALAMAHLYKMVPAVSMLVTRIEGDFVKRATDVTTFTCEDGWLIHEAIQSTVQSGEPITLRAKSFGRNKAGEEVATFYITWSFKVRAQRS